MFSWEFVKIFKTNPVQKSIQNLKLDPVDILVVQGICMDYDSVDTTLLSLRIFRCDSDFVIYYFWKCQEREATQPAISCSKLTFGTLEQGVQYVQS